MLSDKFWNKYFEVYDILNELYPYQNLLQLFVQAAQLQGNEVVLDAGAGTGNLALLLKNKGAKIYAIDISDAGTRKLLEKIPEAETCVGSLCAPLPYPDNFFDLVVSNNVIYTLPEKDRPAVAREFHRVLKSGGTILISNISPGFNPIKIYRSHLNEEVRSNGILKTIFKAFRFIIPTIKMFWYNALIKKENAGGQYAFLSEHNQEKFLKHGGFTDIRFISRTYADQAVMHQAEKHA